MKGEPERTFERWKLSRRQFLGRAYRLSLLGTLASLGSFQAASCGGGNPPRTEGSSATGEVPRLPEGSPDFDLLDTLLQLEHRAVALTSETRQGRRLGDKASEVVDRIAESHRAHIAVLERVVRDAGATPDPPRNRYTLPTPLGDERRALGLLLEDEANLVAKYADGLRRLQTVRLGRAVGSMLFSCKTHSAALERLLDRCSDPSFTFEVSTSESPGLPAAPDRSASPSPVASPLPSSLVLQALASFERAAGRMCAVAAEKVLGALQALEQRAAPSGGQSPPATLPPLTRLEVVGYCVVARDAEGRTRGPASADLPDVVSVLNEDKGVSDESKSLVSAAVSLLQAMASGHEQRAGYWTNQAGSEPLPQLDAATSSSPIPPRLPDELSPTAAGLSEERIAQRDSARQSPPGEVFQAVVDSEVKTATALAVAASNLASEELRSRAGAALLVVATVTSRLVGLATGGEFVVSQV